MQGRRGGKTGNVALFHPPIPEPAETGSLPMGYVEDCVDPRTPQMAVHHSP